MTTIPTIHVQCRNYQDVKEENSKKDREHIRIIRILFQCNPSIPRNRYIAPRRVAIVGAGMAGATAALRLARCGIKVDLFEKDNAIFMGSSAIPTHLYSGVQYFGDISPKSIRQCMHDAIAFARTLPFCVNPRPTIVALAKQDNRTPDGLEAACIMNQAVYATACLKDVNNEVFGPPSHFYRKYTREQIDQILRKGKNNQQNLVEIENDRWVANFAKQTDLDGLQFPIFLIREYGLDMRYAAGFIEQLIKENSNIRLFTSTEVTKIARIAHGIALTASTPKWELMDKYHVMVDASGKNLGLFEFSLGVERHRLLDVKFAGLFTSSGSYKKHFPEIYILGGKGQPAGTSFMSHISPVNSAKKRLMLVNITTPLCTYIADGKKSNKGAGIVQINEENPLARETLNNKNSHMPRLQNMIKAVSVRHERLAKHLEPVCGFPGSVAILGRDINGRDSFIDSHPGERFISLNITKAGAAPRVAGDLLAELQQNYGIFSGMEQGNPSFMPRDILSAMRLTEARYLKLG